MFLTKNYIILLEKHIGTLTHYEIKFSESNILLYHSATHISEFFSFNTDYLWKNNTRMSSIIPLPSKKQKSLIQSQVSNQMRDRQTDASHKFQSAGHRTSQSTICHI
jgi:hypothetical protein